MCASLRPSLRLIGNAAGVQFTPLLIFQAHAAASTVSIAVHRFEELIGGHPYLIEVAAVANDRWRACIVRIPGGPIALMPFYGPTPDEAASRLRQWLTRAHEPASGGMAKAVLAYENPRGAVLLTQKPFDKAENTAHEVRLRKHLDELQNQRRK
jgi:hypothetical protein